MSSRLMTMTGVVLALVLLFAVNILVSRTLGSARIDLTENRLFTLSEGTRSILASIEEPVTLRFHLSQRELGKVPGIGSYADRVRALLNEYERLSGGKLALHVIDPEPFSEEEDRAVAYGLRGVPLGSTREASTSVLPVRTPSTTRKSSPSSPPSVSSSSSTTSPSSCTISRSRSRRSWAC